MKLLGHGISAAEAHGMVVAADTDGDGGVSIQEFLCIMSTKVGCLGACLAMIDQPVQWAFSHGTRALCRPCLAARPPPLSRQTLCCGNAFPSLSRAHPPRPLLVSALVSSVCTSSLVIVI